ncbi:hypothetical protein BGX27_010646 [Mortierella sp. AM989]|nr:hypothetical protein BGX27_010646 [Mortierella sp. AM989]
MTSNIGRRQLIKLSPRDIKKVVIFPQDCLQRISGGTMRGLTKSDLTRLLCDLSSHQQRKLNWSSFMDALLGEIEIDSDTTVAKANQPGHFKQVSTITDNVWMECTTPIEFQIHRQQKSQDEINKHQSYTSLILGSITYSANITNSVTLVLMLDRHDYSENNYNRKLQSEAHSYQGNSLIHTQTSQSDVKLSNSMGNKNMISTPSLPLQTTSLSKLGAVIQSSKVNNGIREETMASHVVETATMAPKPNQLKKDRIPVNWNPVHRRGMQSTAQRFMQRFHSFRLVKVVQDATILARDDSMTGNIVMVLMSTICGLSVGLLGALLFVVALKVRIFQTRRWSQQQQQGTHPHQPIINQQIRESGCKRVVPPGVLDSFGVQTVLHTSTTEMTTTAVVKLEAAAFTKLCYAEDVIEMEEGLEDILTRENARRQRLRTRTSYLLSRSEVSQGQNVSDVRDNGAEWDSSSEEDEETEEIIESDLERITAAIMNATRRGSYRRISQSRQGQSDSERVQTSTSLSSSLSLSPSQSMILSEDKKHKTVDGVHGHQHEKEKLPFANANAQTMCSICLSDYEVGDQVRTLPCHHQYHMSCIDPWLLSVASLCPICKRDLLPGSV